MDSNYLGIWFPAGVPTGSSSGWRGKNFLFLTLPWTAALNTLEFQVSYSQTLGVIGYCLLPLVITAPVVSALQFLPWSSMFIKVWLSVFSLRIVANMSVLVVEDVITHQTTSMLWFTKPPLSFLRFLGRTLVVHDCREPAVEMLQPAQVLGIAWATYSGGSLLARDELRHKKPLLLYPIFLLYVYLYSLYSGVWLSFCIIEFMHVQLAYVRFYHHQKVSTTRAFTSIAWAWTLEYYGQWGGLLKRKWKRYGIVASNLGNSKVAVGCKFCFRWL